MENDLERSVENHHFEIREKIQSELIRDFYGYNTQEEITTENAFKWISARSEIFRLAFDKIVAEYPSFFEDADKDFETALELVKQKVIEEENKLR